jgi:hypothetical protein
VPPRQVLEINGHKWLDVLFPSVQERIACSIIACTYLADARSLSSCYSYSSAGVRGTRSWRPPWASFPEVVKLLTPTSFVRGKLC